MTVGRNIVCCSRLAVAVKCVDGNGFEALPDNDGVNNDGDSINNNGAASCHWRCGVLA